MSARSLVLYWIYAFLSIWKIHCLFLLINCAPVIIWIPLDGMYRSSSIPLDGSNVDNGIDLLISNRCVTIFIFLVWFSPRFLNLVRLKKRSHRTYKRTSAYGDCLLVNNLRTKCKNVSKGCYTRCINNTERLILDYNNTKIFSSFVNSHRNNCKFLNNMYLNDIKTDNH